VKLVKDSKNFEIWKKGTFEFCLFEISIELFQNILDSTDTKEYQKV
jgi:hypothetical protein